MGSLFQELSRRNVFKVAIAYLVAAWIVIQVAEVLSGVIALPEWAPRLVVFLLILGFIPAVVIAWAYQRTPDGIERDRGGLPESVPGSGRGNVFEHVVVAVLGIVVVGIAVFWFTGRDARWARGDGITELDRLVSNGEFEAAYVLANRIEIVLPGDAELEQLWRQFTRLATIPSDPPGASVYRKAYNAPDVDWKLLGRTPINDVRIPIGMSLLRIEHDGFHTQLRIIGNGFLVPNDMRVAARSQNTDFGANPERYLLDPVDAAPADMVRVPGSSVAIDGDLVELDDFFISRYEVTNKEYKAFVDADGYRRSEFWEHEFVLDGERIEFDDAIARMVDRSGRPGPADWEGGTFRANQATFPVTGVSWHEAAAFARFAGRELPTIHHWRRAFSLGMLAWILPASNLGQSSLRSVDDGRDVGWTGTYGMAGNAREWCFNSLAGFKTILGGGFDDPLYMVRNSIQDPSRIPAFDRSASNGFRLMLIREDSQAMLRLREPLTTVADNTLPEPASDAVFNVYRSSYDYDAVPLNAAIEISEERQDWKYEFVSFDTSGGERMFAHLFLPLDVPPPYQVVITWPGIGALFVDRYDTEGANEKFIVRNGRALAVPVMAGTWQRRHSTVPPWTTIAGKDLSIEQVRDFRRAIDYLESRSDIQSDKIGYYGVSWGGRMGPLVLAVEPRIKVAVLNQAGFIPTVHRDINAVHFLPRVTVPVLQFNGLYDAIFPYETRAKPFFDGLGTPVADKKHVVEPTGHFVSQPVYIGETLDWLDKYLGVVNR
ncbi:MAG: SUMF1/EgtB/PvdO family nonheme iron enzyme [Proteobacteria bacterium]|nr:SUMF1/EgtB/PvdO family nonheme iron enzyme [Pseudomonadota bacterium]